MRLIIISLLIVVSSCTKKIAVIPSSSVWVTYDLIIDIKTKEDINPIESLALNELVKKELIGTKVVFNQNTFSLSYTSKRTGSGQVGQVVKITEDYFITKVEDVEQKITYRMSSDKQRCDFTFPDGTILYTERQN
jgi:hypothetical protein